MTLTRSSFLTGAGLATLAMALPRAARAKDWTLVRVATEGAFPPFNMHSPSGQLIGFEPELLVELARRMKVKTELTAQEWNGVIDGLNADKWDAIMDAVSITPKREEVIGFSIPYVASPSTFAVLKEGGPALPGTGQRVQLGDQAATEAAIGDLKKAVAGKTVGVQVATIQLDFLNTYLKDALTIRTYPASGDAMLDLKAGRVDLVMASGSNLVSVVEKSRGTYVMAGYGFLGGLLGRGSAVALRKGDTELKALFDGAIRSMIEDGSMKTLVMKWFGYDVTAPLGA
jgi:octopine/nopaline transport system substrate-binding protein